VFRTLRFAIVGGLLAVALLGALSAGCAAEPKSLTAAAEDGRDTCGGADCHEDVVLRQTGGPHAAFGCLSCHDGADGEHSGDPAVAAGIDWRIDACSACHGTVAATYLYDDNMQVGPFGGSQREPAQPKRDTFPEYDTIVAGHAFSRDYNEEGAHAYMLEDHYETLRGKFETCVQCKSTKISWAWKTGRPLVVSANTTITLTHTKTAATPTRELMIPAGTVVRFGTDAETREVTATAQMPDGKIYTSRPSQEPTENFNGMWAATIAATKETWPYGAGCNHCHDPHGADLRVLRSAMLGVIEDGGVNPYAKDAPTSFDEASLKDKEILTCAQCHVEYTCGKSGVDGIDRDAYGWAKAVDLHDLYTTQFGYTQDWKHALIGEPLIKSQHPETELYWQSPHYAAGASCSDCHMPRVRDGNTYVRSHWFTSPYKYGNTDTYQAFTDATGLDARMDANPCERCHSDRTERGVAQQQAVFEKQKTVQSLLATSATALGKVTAARKAGENVDEVAWGQALESHRKAHVIWENLIVSENSMGFHNYDEVMTSLGTAEAEARSAITIVTAMK
jgi:formate-dependent nitrite reductase cytochrome c552 subunit